jgi:hypothetical protein
MWVKFTAALPPPTQQPILLNLALRHFLNSTCNHSHTLHIRLRYFPIVLFSAFVSLGRITWQCSSACMPRAWPGFKSCECTQPLMPFGIKMHAMFSFTSLFETLFLVDLCQSHSNHLPDTGCRLSGSARAFITCQRSTICIFILNWERIASESIVVLFSRRF